MPRTFGETHLDLLGSPLLALRAGRIRADIISDG